MFYVLKGLILQYKVSAYQKAIHSMTAARAKLREKQGKYNAKLVKYRTKLAEHTNEQS